MGSTLCSHSGASQVSELTHDESHCHETTGSTGLMRRSASNVRNWEEAVKKDISCQKLYSEYQSLLADNGADYATLATGFQSDDCLLVVDMQNDFVPADAAPEGGRFAVAEGQNAAIPIADMLQKAAQAKSFIIATRDYHPNDHCSFLPSGGHFPPHCIQGSPGSKLYEPVKSALTSAKAGGADVRIVFKGFQSQTDSFGGIAYGESYFKERHLGNDAAPNCQACGCSLLDWTGSFGLKCSNIDEDLDAPPDVCAVYDRQSLASLLKQKAIKRIFVCGLALDFCVLDSALNAATANLCPGGVFLVVDAARAAHIPGIGTFGSGFLSDPKDLVAKTAKANVKLVNSGSI